VIASSYPRRGTGCHRHCRATCTRAEHSRFVGAEGEGERLRVAYSPRRRYFTRERENADRIGLIGRRVKPPRSPLIERSARAGAYLRVYARQVFPARALRASSRLTRMKERLVNVARAATSHLGRGEMKVPAEYYG